MKACEVVNGRRIFEGAGHSQHSPHSLATADLLALAKSSSKALAADRIIHASYRERRLITVSYMKARRKTVMMAAPNPSGVVAVHHLKNMYGIDESQFQYI